MSIDINAYKQKITKERNLLFKTSFERAYQAFIELGYNKKEPSYFLDNASKIIEKMRKQCWLDFLTEEKLFTAHMLEYLIPFEKYNTSNCQEAIKHYVNVFPEHIYTLCLSNTQSRRSRAGKEFEHILELVLISAGVDFDSQGNIGKDNFIKKGLGKLVDIVSPGVTEFEINKRNTILISAKTTLRERWQEVPEEMGRTGAREMFLATLDDKISNNVLNTLYEANIQLTTTYDIKKNNLNNNNRIISFEELIKLCLENKQKWSDYKYSHEQTEQAIALLDKQIEKHTDHKFIKKALQCRKSVYKN